MRFLFAIMCGFVLCGCTTPTIEVSTVKPWENHYMTVEQFKDGTENISLDKGESIWVLSNKTLSRLLKNAQGD